MACIPCGGVVFTARPRDRAVAIPPTGCPGGVAMLAFNAGPFTLMVKGPVGNLHVAVAFRALNNEILANKIQRWLSWPFSDKTLPGDWFKLIRNKHVLTPRGGGAKFELGRFET